MKIKVSEPTFEFHDNIIVFLSISSFEWRRLKQKGILSTFSKGGFRRRDTARGHPSNPPSRSSATPKPPLYYLQLCAQGTPFTHPPRWVFQGHSFTKDNNWNCNLFFFRKYAFQMKNIKHTHTLLYVYI